jgi:hypothetical protein
MPKTCAQAVGGRGITVQFNRKFSTSALSILTDQWKKTPVYPHVLHHLCIQFCTPKLPQITPVAATFSPLSTPLIMSTNSSNKKNILLPSRG